MKPWDSIRLAASLVSTSPLWKSTDRIRQTIRKEFAGNHFTHVIAGTEAAIYPAALSRCMLGCDTCSDRRDCPAHEFWDQERDRIANELTRITLAEVTAFERANQA